MIATSLLTLFLAADPTQSIRMVGKEGVGNEEATAAMKALVKQGPAALEPTLKAFTGASPAAKNWLRMTVASIVQNDAGQKRVGETIRAVVTKSDYDPDARTCAYDHLQQFDPAFAKTLLPKFIVDPSIDLRRLAIADRLTANPKTDELVTLFDSSRDKDQAERIAKLLEDSGTKVDLTAHFGYLTQWSVIGPFDSPEGQGFAKSFPPEQGYDGKTTLTGKADAKLKWKAVNTSAKYGMVNLNQELGKAMDAVGYATTVVSIEKETPCEIRVGSKNAVQIFLNDKKLFEREAYHHGFAMDQHVAVGTLKAGPNRITLKVVQNNQKDSWAQDWAFNLRVCDATGGKLPLTTKAE